MDLELQGRRAVVTGGTRGIGKAIARRLAAEGVDVVVSGRDAERAQQAATELAHQSGRRVLPFVADSRDDEAVRRLIDHTVAELGGVDILVNNAATPGSVHAPGPLDTVADAHVLDDVDIKVVGYLRAARAVAPHLVRQGWGRIVNVSGLSARRTGSIVGSIRNVGVVALSKNLADELGPHGVTVNVVHPGFTLTERTDRHIPDPPGTTIGRLATVDEVAALVAFLASPLAGAITGDAIAVGGGTPGPIYP